MKKLKNMGKGERGYVPPWMVRKQGAKRWMFEDTGVWPEMFGTATTLIEKTNGEATVYTIDGKKTAKIRGG